MKYVKSLTAFWTSFSSALILSAGNVYATTSNLPYTNQLVDVQNFIGGPWTTVVGGSAVALAGLGWMRSDGGTIAHTASKVAFGGATAYSATSLAVWMGSSSSTLM